jgi:hypothetical protein
MARITTSNSAAPAMMAAVGLNPKIVLRSTTTVRGSADPSSRRSDRADVSPALWSAFTSPDGFVGSLLGAGLLGAGADGDGVAADGDDVSGD